MHVGLINEAGYPHTARLDFVDNQVDPNHGTIRARAVLDNRDGRIHARPVRAHAAREPDAL